MLTRREFLQIVAASAGVAVTGTELLSRAVASASPALTPHGSRGVRHIVVLMMENRSFDHFLGWLPGADGRHNLRFVSAVDGNTYPNYALAPDFQGCGYSDPDHSWEGFLVQHNYGRMDGFLRRPTTPGGFPGVTLVSGSLLAATTTGTSRSSPSGPARRSNRAPRSSTRPSFIPSPTGTRRRFRLARRSSTPARRAPSLTSASSTRPSTAAARGLRGTTTLCLTLGWASASSPTPTTHWPTTATSTTRSWS